MWQAYYFFRKEVVYKMVNQFSNENDYNKNNNDDKILKDKTIINGGNMFRKVKKRVRLQKLSKLGRKIVNTPYNRSDLVNNIRK